MLHFNFKGPEEEDAVYEEMTMNEIINGKTGESGVSY